MKPTHLDLFSGIGGFALAAQWSGFETIGFSEIDSYASQVLKKHWPNVPNYGDVRTIPTVRCDLITGGFPCQPFSFAGKRRGSSDDRHLWPAMRDVIGRCQPAWVLGENVPGIIGVELNQVLADLEGLGYRVQPFVVPACAVDALHRRDRVWIVAHTNGRINERGSSQSNLRSVPGRNGEENGNVADAMQSGLPEPTFGEFGGFSRQAEPSKGSQPCRTTSERRTHWPTEPDVGRVANGVPRRVDRLKGLGNSIVPQVAQVFLQAIHAALT